MKPGDIVTHCYHGRAHGIMGQEKQFLLKEVVEAQRAGIIFDCAHGRNHFNFRMIEKALDQGFLPDTISTDLTVTSATRGPVWDLPTTMTKLLHFGMSLEEIVRRSTAAPAKIMGYEGTVGTLKPGANADISVFELRDGKFELTDSDRDTDHRETPAAGAADAEGRPRLVRRECCELTPIVVAGHRAGHLSRHEPDEMAGSSPAMTNSQLSPTLWQHRTPWQLS